MKEYPNFKLIKHSLINHKLGIMRNKNTSGKEFGELVNEIAILMSYEMTKELPTVKKEIDTPICPTQVDKLYGKQIVLVPILRAGIGMVEGVKNIIPNARVGHIGMKRNETTLQPETYYVNFPSNPEKRTFILIDPMLATGGSASAAADEIKKHGAEKIMFMCLIAAPEGVDAFCKKHSDIEVICAALDDKLNENGYIVPGLGDAGDRIFGTL